jgi:hypothetical protein
MVDNFALLVSQLMMIIVLWRCYSQTEDGKARVEPRRIGRKPKRQGGPSPG